MEQLYLLEVLVDTLRFSPRFAETPEKKDIIISVVFSNLAHLDIESDSLRGFNEKHDPFKRDLDINSGKSYLFPSKPEELLNALNVSPLRIIIRNKSDAGTMGEIVIPWGLEFVDMVDKSKYNSDNVTPACVKNTYDVNSNEGGEVVGDIDLFIRLSCYGKSIQTQFQVVTRQTTEGTLPSQRFLFKSSDADATFQAQKIGSEQTCSDIVPIAPLYNPADPRWHPQTLSPTDLTADKINEMLCKNKDCPGVQKFKEFGLGPAATGKGLGTLYGSIDIPISYGLSHTYGSLEHYGPYGIYTRPKSLDQPFIPKDRIECSNTPGCHHCGSCKPKCDDAVSSSTEQICDCGNETSYPGHQNVVSHQENDSCCCCSSDPLRLSGGSPNEDESKTPQPMMMCKDLMQSYDRVLNKYKKALGPCGQVICPYAPNVAADNCKKYCSGEVSGTENPVAGPSGCDSLVSACGTPGCPFSRQADTATDRSFQNKQMKSACGSPTCPYTKRKLGTATSEDMLEMQLMDGPSIAKACGSPKCPFPIAPLPPPLEPIHWDCSDPLPKGPCKNPLCPLKPKELRYNLIPKGPCGSSKCPYATPPFCGDSSCPFGPPQSCPYVELQQCPPTPQCEPGCGGASAQPFCPLPSPNCGGPNCPYSKPVYPPSPAYCGGPPCPYAQPPPPTPCGNPSCPFAQSSTCGNLDCPYAMTPSAPSSSPCGAPTCPYATPARGPCGSPDCKYATMEKENPTCANPECPYATRKESPCYMPQKESPCYIPQTPGSGDVCGNPECPYAEKKPSPCFVPPKDSVCSNPNCPYASPPCPYVYPCKLNIGGTKVTVEYGLDGKEKESGKESITVGEDTLRQETGTGDGRTEYASGDRDTGECLEPCSPRTCKAYGGGGNLVCGDCKPGAGRGGGGGNRRTMQCPCGGTLSLEGSPSPSQEILRTEKEIVPTTGKVTSQSAPSISQKPQQELERISASEKAISQNGKNGKNGKCGKKPKGKYVYKLGDLYPGVNIGHKECIIPGRNVPAKMGWLWNVHVPCVGLKPRIGWRPGAVGRTVAKKILAHRKAKGLKLLEPLTPKASKKKLKSKYSEYESDSDVTVAPKPTLLVKKREGCYYITMNPLKDPKTIEDNENPYMDCTPLQFKICKKKDEEEEKTCYCDEGEEESSDSELDIEFTPPAGIIRPERLKKKKNVCHTDTQYNTEDFITKEPRRSDDKKGKGGKKDKKGKGGKGGKGGKKGKKGK